MFNRGFVVAVAIRPIHVQVQPIMWARAICNAKKSLSKNIMHFLLKYESLDKALSI